MTEPADVDRKLKGSDSGNSLVISDSDDSKKYGIDHILVPKSDHYLAILVFCAFGTAQLLIWNMILNYAQSMQVIWPNTSFLGILGGVEHGAAILAAIVMFKFDAFNIKHATVWSIINVFLFLLMPLVPQFVYGESAAFGLMTAACALLGLASGFLHVFAYAFSSITPYNYTGYVSTGNGIAGIVSFALYIILFEGFFDKNTRGGQVALAWVFFPLGALVALILSISFWKLSRKTWFLECIELSRQSKREDKELALKEFGERRPFLAILGDCWVQTLCVGMVFFSTLFVFPVTGPYSWHQSPTTNILLNGTFQVVDLLTRFMPMAGKWTRVPEKYVWICVVLRPLIFIPLFVIPAVFPGAPFISSTPWLFVVMLLFTVTNGWLITVATLYSPESVSHPQEKEIVAEILVMAILGGVTLGVFASDLLPLIYRRT